MTTELEHRRGCGCQVGRVTEYDGRPVDPPIQTIVRPCSQHAAQHRGLVDFSRRLALLVGNGGSRD